MSRWRTAIGAAVVALVVVGAAFVVLGQGRRGEVAGMQAVGDPFGADDTIVANADDAVLSPDGTRLAVLDAEGLGLAIGGELRRITEPGTRVVDVAWFANGATVLVAEGPVPTGGLAVVDADGTVRGTVPLSPSIGFGTGHGLTIAPGGRTAVATAVERPALGTEQRHLALIDLETGATRPLTRPRPESDDAGPFFVDRTTIAFTERATGGVGRPQVMDVASGRLVPLAPAGAVIGVAGPWVLLLDGRSVTAVRGDGAGSPVELGEAPDGVAVVAADGVAGRLVVIDRQGRIRRVTISAVPPAE